MASNGKFQGLLESLKKNPLNRTTKDILGISSVIHEYFESLNLDTIKYLSSFAHYISFEKDVILFNVNDQADCWFILLTGKILLKGKEFYAPCSFGKIYDGKIKRTYQCRSVEYCQLMKIFYPSTIQIDTLENMMNESTHQQDQGRFESSNCVEFQNNNNKIINDSSDDDEDDEENFQESFLEFDFSDLTNESFASITVKDVVQECLEKNPDERTNHDVDVLRNFMLHFNNQVFNSFQKEIQDLICRKLSYVVIEKEGTVVLGEGEDLKYWAFVINGCLEVTHACDESYNRLICMGDSFGIDPRNDDVTKSPFMVLSKVPSCHFMSLAKEDWTFIKNNKEGRCVEKETIEDGKKVLVVEEREIKKGGRKGYFVKKGTSEQLIKFLADERSTEDPTYVEDFLLTSRIFLRDGMSSLTDHLMSWFNNGGRLRDKSVRIVLLWVNNHFEDFEADYALSHFLMSFMQSMQTHGMSGQLELLHRACCAQAKLRKVAMERSSSSQPWGFNLVQGKESGKVFVDTTTFVSQQMDNKRSALLVKGDQILEINGKTTITMTNKNIVELINKSLKIELLVKCNFVEHSEVLSQRSRNIFPKQSCSQEESEKGKKKSEWTTRRLFNNVIEPFIKKINIFGQNALTPSSLSPSNSRNLVTGSNPDLSSFSKHLEPNMTHGQISPADILNIYLVNQSKPISLAAGRSQNVHQLVKVALKLSGLNGDPSNYSLFEVTFKDDKVMKYSRLPDCSTNLQSMIKDDMRIYLVSNSLIETNWVNELNLNGGSQGHVLWHMKPHDVATELCLRDFHLFRNIQSSEYLYHLFKNNTESDSTNLGKFSKLVNEEMFWVATEICSEGSLDGRVKLIQFFLKVVQHCLEMNNFNSTFAILSGLRHNSVSKLKQTWKRVPTKYMKLFESLQDLMDPSNNMSKYRSLLSVRLAQSPAIPFFPIVMKDLTFIDLGNRTFIDGMINYEKMRMIAKQISSVTNMASPFYHNKSLESQAASNTDTFSLNVTAFATIRKKKTPHIISTQLKSEENVGLAKKYLDNLKIIQNEEELGRMSLNLEPPRISSRSKSEHSPQNSTKSSQESKTSFKFGTDSPQSHQKLMSLTDKVSRQPHLPGIQEGGRKRPNALSVSNYDTLTLTMRKGIEPFNPFKKGYEARRRDAVLLSPTCNSKVVKPVRLNADSSSVSAPIRYNPTISISKALFAITNQKPFNMALKSHAEKSSISYSAEELDDLFVNPHVKSQSTPVSPSRSIPVLSPSSSGSTPKIPLPQSSFDDSFFIKPSSSINLNSTCSNHSTHPTEMIKIRGMSLDEENSMGKDKKARPQQENEVKKKRRSLTRQRKETSLDLPFQEFTSSV